VNYPEIFDVKCKLDRCSVYPMVTDTERGEVVCGGCGLVLLQRLEDTSHENTSFTQDEYMTKTRTGPATSLSMYDMGLSTNIGYNTDATGNSLSAMTKTTFNRLRMWDQRSKSKSSTRNLTVALTILSGITSKLGIPEHVTKQAAYIHRKIIAAKLTRGRSIRSLIAASLYAACRETNTPRTLDDIANAANVEKKLLSRDLRTIIKELDLHLKQYDNTGFITRLSNDLGIKEKTKRDAFEILEKSQEKRIADGKNPVAQAAACLYLSCLINNEKLSQRRFSEMSGISSVTIRCRIAAMRKALNLKY
jgi:transcription initiation factor TFIIB